MNSCTKIRKLKDLMKNNNIDFYIIPTSDPHQSEYIADHYQARKWISGFTGSAGTLVVSKDKSILWTDGRYFIQAEKELQGSGIELYKVGIPGYPSYVEWIAENIKDGETIGFDGKVISQSIFEQLESKLSNKHIKFKSDKDLVDEIWKSRPVEPITEVFILKEDLTGMSVDKKLELVREEMRKKQVEYFIISSLDDIAWLYNIRGRDILNNPVSISYALVGLEEAFLFIDERKINESVKEYLDKNNILIRPYLGIKETVSKIKNTQIILDKNKVNHWLYDSIHKSVKVFNELDITTNLKAIKNEIEIKNQKNAYIKDGVALTKLFYYIENNLDRDITELDVSKKLEQIRKEFKDYIEPSFTSIAAYGPNAAMMHYSASPENNSVLRPEGMFLLDAGSQFMDGTTDTTRTIALGKLTKEEKIDYTLTLKAHIGLIKAKFLKGTTGLELDAICRYPLWQEGLDYKCGTGHGVGFLLNVHEGPQSISPRYNGVSLKPGMVVTIEPGVYKTGKHGIRIENVAVVKEDIKTESGQFLSFDLLSFVYIDTGCIEKSLLSEDEKNWLNSYNYRVYDKISPQLNKDERKWLKEKTKKI